MSECNPSDLISREITGLSPAERRALKLRLLQGWASDSSTTNELSIAARSYFSLTPSQKKAVMLELLCRISTA